MENPFLPQSLMVEQAVIGAALSDHGAQVTACDLLPFSECFSDERHRLIWSGILALNQNGLRADLVSLTDKLDRDGKEGLFGVLSSIASGLPDAANVEHYAELVLESWRRREVTRACLRAASDSGDSGSVIRRLSEKLASIGERTPASGASLAEAARAVYRELADERDPISVVSPWPELRALVPGLMPGQLVILAARPSVGKSALALQWALEAARDGKAVWYQSLEMSRAALVRRAISIVSGVPCSRITRKILIQGSENQGGDREKIQGAISRMESMRLHISDAWDGHPSRVLARVRASKIRDGCDLVVLDYLQLVEWDDKRLSTNEAIARITRGYKKLAIELGVPVLLLSQLNRKGDEDPSKEPQLAWLRDSGAIEQDADIVLFLTRYTTPDPLNPGSRREREARLWVTKQREGPTGSLALTFLPELTAFKSRAPK